MRTVFLLIVSILCCCNISCSNELPFDSYEEEELEGVPFADPYILLVDTTYYAFGTYGAKDFRVYSSSNLVDWYLHDELALIPDNSFGSKGFWAPEVYYNANTNKYLMYYTVENYVAVAESDTPYGPFKQEEQKSLMSFLAFDPTVFTDDDGTNYIYYCVNNGDFFEIWVAKLSKDGKSMDYSVSNMCISADQKWERNEFPVNEGPFVIKHNGYYYMIYSGSLYENSNYAIGYAVAEHPAGPWEKYSGNPILHKPSFNGKVLEGTGHGSIFKDKNGQLRLVFHAHYLPGQVHPRQMYITSVHFTNDKVPRMYFGEDIVKAHCVGTKTSGD